MEDNNNLTVINLNILDNSASRFGGAMTIRDS